MQRTFQLRIPFESIDFNPENEFDIIEGDTDRLEKLFSIEKIITNLVNKSKNLSDLNEQLLGQVFEDTEENTARNINNVSKHILSLNREIDEQLTKLYKIKELIENYQEGEEDSEYVKNIYEKNIIDESEERSSLNSLHKKTKEAYFILNEIDMPKEIPFWYERVSFAEGENYEPATYLAFSGFPVDKEKSIKKIMEISDLIDSIDKVIDRFFLTIKSKIF